MVQFEGDVDVGETFLPLNCPERNLEVKNVEDTLKTPEIVNHQTLTSPTNKK